MVDGESEASRESAGDEASYAQQQKELLDLVSSAMAVRKTRLEIDALRRNANREFEKLRLEIRDLRWWNPARIFIGAVVGIASIALTALVSYVVANGNWSIQREVAHTRQTELYAKALQDLGGSSAPARAGAVTSLRKFADTEPERSDETIAVLVQALTSEHDPSVNATLEHAVASFGGSAIGAVAKVNRISSLRLARSVGLYLSTFPREQHGAKVHSLSHVLTDTMLPFDVQFQAALESGGEPAGWPEHLLRSDRMQNVAVATIESVKSNDLPPVSRSNALREVRDAAIAVTATGYVLGAIIHDIARANKSVAFELSNVVLVAADLRELDLSKSDFQNAFINGDASRMTCNRCDLRHADLVGLQVTDAVITNSKLEGAWLTISMPGHGEGTFAIRDLRGSDWWRANVSAWWKPSEHASRATMRWLASRFPPVSRRRVR